MDAERAADIMQANRAAWNAARYEAWHEALGSPADAAARLQADPARAARRILPHLGPVAGKRICNVQGSHGRLAVSLALLGAQVTVIDFAEDNRRYAAELADAAQVSLDYVLANVLAAADLGLGAFDALVMELGILHYHLDIAAFFQVMGRLCGEDAALVLHEFHPVQRKLFQPYPGQAPDYFSAELVRAPVPDPTGQDRVLGECQYRFWTLGEVLGAALAAGFQVTRFQEHPDWTDPHIPGAYTLVAHWRPA
ncbi:MAG: methyltransferase domain-containing protein [Phenylobacterium sp.]|uniref:class I SAM-dependent methyltransferase n=1 Tax=Phenylobacterium sp. TaxID=1871053 RepID=UPI002716FB0B|nr:methyltransferase domain-containing protein [Phenylobacterium sp.]MDO8410331.1 methyltransferase domain-containing protein [Phenylobacterium sp.]